MKPIQKKISFAFLLLAAIDITGLLIQSDKLHYVAKSLLIPALLLLLYFTASPVKGKTLLMTGLFFSWAGDMLLLFESRDKLFFIFGLICFLTTHVFYIIYFLRIRSANTSLLIRQPVLTALVPAYGITLVWQLYPHLGDLKLPVMVYAAVICSMLLCSLHVYPKVNKKAAVYYLAGAALFVISDSLLAVNKFYESFAFAGVLIMLSYCAAQYFIIRGYIEQNP